MTGFRSLRQAAVWGQIIMGTLRGGQQNAPTLKMDEPPILPTTSPYLWEITNAFREAIDLDLTRENYKKAPVVVSQRRLDVIANQGYSLYPRPDHEALEREECNGTTDEDQPVQNDYLIEILPFNSSVVASPITVKAYAAEQFSKLRKMYGVSDRQFSKSLGQCGPFVSFQSNSKGAARIGGVFFFSPDGRYLIKSIKKDEVGTFLNMLPQYSDFMQSNGRTTLLTRFYGMYDVTIDGKTQTLVIMNAVFPAAAARSITERYDLKGSTLGRKVSDEERARKGAKAVLKDLDLIVGGGAIGLGAAAKQQLLQQIEADVDLLKNCSVIDYSLLVGVEPVPSILGLSTKQMFLEQRLALADTELGAMSGTRKGVPVVYYFGLIDFLQPFNYKKYLEWVAKMTRHKRETYSCVPPLNYARRLLSFLDTNIQ